jgi:Restriction endonuclease
MNDGLKNVRSPRDDAVSGLDLERLRALLAEYYRRQGYRVDALEAAAVNNVDENADNACFDLQVQRDDSRLLVRCMHWNDKQVPHLRVRAFEDVLAYAQADGAILATSGEFTASAIRTASSSKTMRLVDGAELRKMLMPILNADASFAGDDASVAEHAVEEHAAKEHAAEDRAFADFEAMAPTAPIAAANTASPVMTDVVADAERYNETSFAAESESAIKDEPEHVAAQPVPLAHDRLANKPSGVALSKPKKRFFWERGHRPASTLSFAVASVLLTLIVLTIVFRHRLDPYLGDPPRPVVKAPKNESPLAGTNYKPDVFAPVVKPSQEDATTPKQKPKPHRPSSSIGEPPKAEEAIRVIAPSTPEMWPEEQRRKAAASERK